MARLTNPRLLVGKCIEKVHLNPFPNGRGGTAYDPRIMFSDGSSIAFVTQETQDLAYGTAIIYSPIPRPGGC